MNSRLHTPRFDWLSDSKKCNSRPEWDTVLFETEEFAAIPSLGSLVPGWILIVPKKRIINLAALSEVERGRLIRFTCSIEDKMKTFGQKVYRFEHGGLESSLVSCGVEQAHMHLVPLPFDLVDMALKSTDVDWGIKSSQSATWEGISTSTEYLMMADENRFYTGEVRQPTSQWFRKLIAENTGQPEKWDYKRYPNFENIGLTLTDMAA